MSKVMIYRKKNIPFQKTPVILIQKNKSVNSATGNTHTWTGGSLFPVNALQAPFYGVFINGVFAPYIDVSQLVFSPSVDSTVDLCKIECEVKPYIPRITDGWYPWVGEEDGYEQKELTWIAGENGCRILYSESGVSGLKDYPGFDTIPPGTDLSTYELPLIVPTYDFYIARRRVADGNHYDISSVFNELTEGKAKYSFKTTRTETYDYTYIYGIFGNENLDRYQHYALSKQSRMTTSSYFGSEKYGTQNSFTVQGTIEKEFDYYTRLSGKQTVDEMICACLTEEYQPVDTLPGFLYNGTIWFVHPEFGDYTDYYYAPVWVLKSLEVKKGPITG